MLRSAHGDDKTEARERRSVAPKQYRRKIEEIRKETQVKNLAHVFYFTEENSRAIPGLGRAGINDNDLRSTPIAKRTASPRFTDPSVVT